MMAQIATIVLEVTTEVKFELVLRYFLATLPIGRKHLLKVVIMQIHLRN